MHAVHQGREFRLGQVLDQIEADDEVLGSAVGRLQGVPQVSLRNIGDAQLFRQLYLLGGGVNARYLPVAGLLGEVE